MEEKVQGGLVVGEDQEYNVVKRPVVSVCFGIVAFAVVVPAVQDIDDP